MLPSSGGRVRTRFRRFTILYIGCRWIAFAANRGAKASRFCAGCHDLALLVDGAMDKPVFASDRRANTGITCRMCHGVVAAAVDGNGSVVFRGTPIPIPRPGSP